MLENTYTSEKPCKNGHNSPRRIGNRACLMCEKDRLAKHYLKNKTEVLERQRKRREENVESLSEYHKKYYTKNKVRIDGKNKRWAVENREKSREIANAWRRRNLEKCAALQTRRRSACPVWQNPEDILIFYKVSKDLTAITGVKFHVDHIVPINGKSVCGLHVPWNLCVIRAEDNIKKGNRFNPEEYRENYKIQTSLELDAG